MFVPLRVPGARGGTTGRTSPPVDAYGLPPIRLISASLVMP